MRQLQRVWILARSLGLTVAEPLGAALASVIEEDIWKR
jgi:hypothetical protein